jgi:hypothetical protein
VIEGLPVLYSDYVEKHGIRFFDLACEQDLEGIVAKHRDGEYGHRRLKIKNPHYTQVSPNEWQKQQRRRTEQTVSARAEAYRTYFQRLIDILRDEHRFTSARLGQPQSWYAFATGLGGVTYVASFSLGRPRSR